MTEDELRDLIEQAHLLREFQKDPGYSVWQNACARRIEAKKRELLGGSLKTVQEYRYIAGWIEGAEFALGALEHLEMRIANEREARKSREPVSV